MMAGRVSPIAAPGSLFKGKAQKGKRKPARKGRLQEGEHLKLIRRVACLSCDQDPAGEAAHVRMSGAGKPVTGIGIKPDDRYALPLCVACHTRGPAAQHRVGEPKFWAALGLDPLVIAARLHAASPNIEAMRAVVFAERERRK